MAKTIFAELGGNYVRQGRLSFPLPVLTHRKKKISLLEYGDSGICAISNSTARCFTPTCLQAAS